MQGRTVQESDRSIEGADLFERYGHTLFAYVRLHQLSREDAEDVMLEVFVVALENDNLSALPEGERRCLWCPFIVSHCRMP